jgi:hypothetical protein
MHLAPEVPRPCRSDVYVATATNPSCSATCTLHLHERRAPVDPPFAVKQFPAWVEVSMLGWFGTSHGC